MKGWHWHLRVKDFFFLIVSFCWEDSGVCFLFLFFFFNRQCKSGVFSLQPRMAMNATQHKIVHLLKTLLSFITKFNTKFYYLDTYIFYISNHKLGTCSSLAILKDYEKGHCIIRVIMWGLFCLSLVADIVKIMHGTFFLSSVFIGVCVFHVRHQTTTLLLPVLPRGAERSDTPGGNDIRPTWSAGKYMKYWRTNCFLTSKTCLAYEIEYKQPDYIFTIS